MGNTIEEINELESKVKSLETELAEIKVRSKRDSKLLGTMMDARDEAANFAIASQQRESILRKALEWPERLGMFCMYCGKTSSAMHCAECFERMAQMPILAAHEFNANAALEATGEREKPTPMIATPFPVGPMPKLQPMTDKEWERIMELVHSPEFKAGMKEGLEDIKAGRTTPWPEIAEELGIKIRRQHIYIDSELEGVKFGYNEFPDTEYILERWPETQDIDHIHSIGDIKLGEDWTTDGEIKKGN